ncbi:hypothetical protein EJF36_18255 [Bacillus sp. HMF5848]|uniref:NERD domain-containing protein n=1 Tax=Bacillus sp. HMF5848 TaxID=2495421 RepID=UPI000F7B4A4D|nr:NERD domain-containing protein [Bacillus sp. HMF5848]RSK28652.1 hypothetical protein EJF36_18255 [Bacillus sp. HMF5848]
MNFYKYPLHIQQELALQCRTSIHHPNRNKLDESCGVRLAGHYGEQQVNYYLRQCNLHNTFVYNGIRLIDDCTGDAFQIDKSITTRKLLIPLEVKNLSGELIFGANGQFTQIKNGEEIKHFNPLSQVNIQRDHLTTWLHEHLNVSLPIEPLVVFTHPSAIIRFHHQNPDYNKRIVTLDTLPDKIKQLLNTYYNQKTISDNYFELLNQKLYQDHTPFLHNDVLKKFLVNWHDITTGVECLRCNEVTMEILNRKWHCKKCGTRISNEVFHSLYTYFLLFKQPLTNKRASWFLGTQSRGQTERALQSMPNLLKVGSNRGTKYFMNIDKRPDFVYFK